MFTTAFWKASAERAIKTFAQTLVILLGANQVDVISIDWPHSLSLAAGAALVSILTSIGSDWVSAKSGPSLTDAEVLPEPEIVAEAA